MDSLSEVRQKVYRRLELVFFMLENSGWTIGTAESCTGGLLAALLSELPGSSIFFKGGVVAYDNFVKTHVLGVSSDLVRVHGAVSQETAEAMALGCLGVIQSDIGVSLTGIAGPQGGTPQKPVGLVYCGLSFKAESVGKKFGNDSVMEGIFDGLSVKKVGILENPLNVCYQLNIQIPESGLEDRAKREMIRWITCGFVLEIFSKTVL